MKKIPLLLLAALLSLPATWAASDPGGTAVVPAPRVDEYGLHRHEEFLQRARRGGIDLLFLGDSIMEQWELESVRGVADPGVIPRGKPIWERDFLPLHAADFSVSGDRTQNLLWRFEHGELDGIHPRAVMLMIGSNNARETKEWAANTAPEIVAGITRVVAEIRRRLPAAKILLLGVFPRGLKDEPLWAEIRAINAAIAHLDDGKSVRFLDIGYRFLAADGSLSTELFPDHVHPSRTGFEIWADAIRQPLAELMR